MSLVDVDTWLTEYAACERLSTEIQAQFTERSTQTTVNSPEYGRLTSTIRMRLTQFGNELEQLNRKTINGMLTRAEQERRRRQIETLQSRQIYYQTQFAENSDHNNRAQLFAKSTAMWEDEDDDDQDVPLYRAGGQQPQQQQQFSVAELRQQQRSILEDQDDALDSLTKIISRQKESALLIGNEVEDQNRIIDGIAINVDNVNTRIGNETGNVRTVSSMESGTCGYWVVIFTLFAAIVLVGLL